MHHFKHKAGFLSQAAIGPTPLSLGHPERESIRQTGADYVPQEYRPGGVRDDEGISRLAAEVEAVSDDRLHAVGLNGWSAGEGKARKEKETPERAHQVLRREFLAANESPFLGIWTHGEGKPRGAGHDQEPNRLPRRSWSSIF